MLGSPPCTPLPSSLSNRPSPAETGPVCSGLCGLLDPCRTLNPSRGIFVLFSLAQKTALSPHTGTTLSPTPHPQCPQIPLALSSWGSGNPHGSPTAALPGWPSRLIPSRPALSCPQLPSLPPPSPSPAHPLRGLGRTWLVYLLLSSDTAMAPTSTMGSWPSPTSFFTLRLISLTPLGLCLCCDSAQEMFSGSFYDLHRCVLRGLPKMSLSPSVLILMLPAVLYAVVSPPGPCTQIEPVIVEPC